MNKKLIKEIESKFIEKINQKNSWGKNEIKSIFSETVADVCLDFIDEGLKPIHVIQDNMNIFPDQRLS